MDSESTKQCRLWSGEHGVWSTRAAHAVVAFKERLPPPTATILGGKEESNETASVLENVHSLRHEEEVWRGTEGSCKPDLNL